MKKFTAIILSLAAAFSLTACGNQESSAAGGNDNSGGFGNFGNFGNNGGDNANNSGGFENSSSNGGFGNFGNFGNNGGDNANNSGGFENSSSNGGFGNFGNFGNNGGNNANSENSGGSNIGAQESTMDFTFYGATYKNCTVVPLDSDKGVVLLLYKDSDVKLMYCGPIKNGTANGKGYGMRVINDISKVFFCGTFSDGQLDGEICYEEIYALAFDDKHPSFWYGNFKNGKLFRGLTYMEMLRVHEYGLFTDEGVVNDGAHYVYNKDGSLDIDSCYSVSNGEQISLSSTNTAFTPEEVLNAPNDHFGYGEQYEMAMEWIDSL